MVMGRGGGASALRNSAGTQVMEAACELAIKCSYRMIRVAGFQSTETRGRTTLV